jgi:hypothetical protein
MTQTIYTFIDGAAFDASLDELGRPFGATYRDVNWQALTKNSLRTFYFDALPTQKDGETGDAFSARLKEKQEKFSFLKLVPGMHVREGFTRLRENSRQPQLQQKGVDVALAVEVHRQTYRENMDVAQLFLNDLDFFPLLEALTDTKVVSELCYRPSKTAAELIEAADRSVQFGTYFLHCSLQLPIREKFTLEGWTDELDSAQKTVAVGNNRFGGVKVVYHGETAKFGISCEIVGGTYATSRNCLELLIAHFEMCAQCTTSWDGGWTPESERGN